MASVPQNSIGVVEYTYIGDHGLVLGRSDRLERWKGRERVGVFETHYIVCVPGQSTISVCGIQNQAAATYNYGSVSQNKKDVRHARTPNAFRITKEKIALISFLHVDPRDTR